MIKEREIRRIPIDRIVPNELNNYEITDLETLKASIEAVGFHGTLSVIGPYEDDTYKLISGERRFTALKELHKENPEMYSNIPCIVAGNADMHPLLQSLEIEIFNLEVRDLDASDKTKHRLNLMRILKSLESENIQGFSAISKFREITKFSDRYTQMYNSIFNAGDDFMDFVQEQSKKGLSIAEASKIANLSDEEREQAIDRIILGENADTVYKDIKDIKAVIDADFHTEDNYAKNFKPTVSNRLDDDTDYQESYVAPEESQKSNDFDIWEGINPPSQVDPVVNQIQAQENMLRKKFIRMCEDLLEKTDENLTKDDEELIEMIKRVATRYS